jgi:hypothetical protein
MWFNAVVKRKAHAPASKQSVDDRRGREVAMTERTGLSQEELVKQHGENLPDREAMSLINANLAAPINLALAANILSDNSIAWADAVQTGTIDQSN